MKKQFFATLVALFVMSNGFAQFIYQNNLLTFARSPRDGYTTTWGGYAHYWGLTNTIGIKMFTSTGDAFMATTSNKLIFADKDRNGMYIDLYCRTLYQTSDEKMKTNIRPLRDNSSVSTYGIRSGYTQATAITDLVKRLNPVRYHWKDEAEYEQHNIRPVKTGVEEYGFIAQELENIIPGAVSMTNDGDRLVNYVALIPILTSAIQELTERVATLESQLQTISSNQ